MMNNEVIEQLRDCVTGRERLVDGNALAAWFAERGIDQSDCAAMLGYNTELSVADALIAANAAPPWAAATNAVATTAGRAAWKKTVSAQAALDAARLAYDCADAAARTAEAEYSALRVVALLAEINRADEEGR